MRLADRMWQRGWDVTSKTRSSNSCGSLPLAPSEESQLPGQFSSVQFSSVQSLSHVLLFVTPWTAAHQASLSITGSRRLLKLMSIESVMPSNHFILCCPLFLLPSIFPSIRVFSKESVLRIRWPEYWTLLQYQSFQ